MYFYFVVINASVKCCTTRPRPTVRQSNSGTHCFLVGWPKFVFGTFMLQCPTLSNEHLDRILLCQTKYFSKKPRIWKTIKFRQYFNKVKIKRFSLNKISSYFHFIINKGQWRFHFHIFLHILSNYLRKIAYNLNLIFYSIFLFCILLICMVLTVGNLQKFV